MARNKRLTPWAGEIYAPGRGESEVAWRRVLLAGLSLLAVAILGAVGYWIIGGGDWAFFDCFYMTLITITTVGYGEILPVSFTENGRIFTMVLLISGMGVSLYFLSSLTAFIIEGELGKAIWRRRMRKKLDRLHDHYIVCGAGETGRSVVEELLDAGRPVVVIEQDQEHLDYLARRVGGQFVGILGDATDDEVLLDCAIEAASGVICTLHSDRDNLYVVVSARQLNADLRIISRAVNDRAEQKLLRAGANATVSPNNIGGRRMAHEILRPSVVGFFDMIVRDTSQSLNVEECLLPENTSLNGLTLATSQIRQVTDALVLSVLSRDRRNYTFNPPSNFVFEAGMTLIVLGDRQSIERLRTHASSP